MTDLGQNISRVEDEKLSSFGYRPQFKRVLGLFGDFR